MLFGGDFEYELNLSKRAVFVKEPVLLTFKVRQTDPKQIIFFEFAPLNDKRLEIKLLQEERDENRQGNAVTFRYLLFAKEAGEIPVYYRFIVKRTSETRLRYNNTGEPVKAKAIDTTDTVETLPPTTLHVEPLPKAVPLMGDFKLDVTVDKKETQAFSPIYLTIRLRGVGALPEPLNLLPKIENVRLFADEPSIHTRYETDGVHYDATFSYALLGSSDFLIPLVKIEGFSYHRGELYSLESKPIHITVKPMETAALVDRKNSPESVYETIETLKRWGIYTLIFLCGYLSALLVARLRGLTKRATMEDRFRKEVKSAKDAKTLLRLLVRTDPTRYAPWIDDLEKAVYRGGSANIDAIKKAVMRAS